ncbi:MAG: BMP family protein [Ilumatobacteraceae bacterium]|jgi:basic membrane lipoprotein Med (substrate-binding protein (PBP1-ABC) superfamily)|nr:BMP family protein [Ilumatobacteraceae bacterium]
MKKSRIGKAFAALALAGFVLTACGGNTGSDDAAESDGVLSVVAAYSSVIEEPWDGVIHEALQEMADAGEITYKYIDGIGYASGAFERAVRQIAEEDKPAIIMGDSFGNEESARKVALDYPDIAFVMGSGGGPAEPNFSVFDNWIHEPAYVSGILAGSLTKTNIIGIVGGIPVPEVNRIVNAFIAGAQSVNPKVVAKVAFINSWFDPAAAKEAALSQISAGADILFAERAGVIEAAAEKGLLSFGNQMDQKATAPESVVTSNVWNMRPTVKYILNQVKAGSYTSQDLKDFSMVAKGGASLAEINTGVTGGIPAEVVAKAQAAMDAIKAGTLRVDINEGVPAGSVTK